MRCQSHIKNLSGCNKDASCKEVKSDLIITKANIQSIIILI